MTGAKNMEMRKHRFNIIDVLFIIAAVAVVAFIIFHAAKSSPPGEENVVFVMQTDMISDDLVGKVAPGDAVYDGDSGRRIGTVDACDTRPAKHTGTSQNGSVVVSEVPGYKTLYVTVTALCPPPEGGAVRSSGVAISAGRRYTLMFPDLYCGAECISVDTSSGEK